MNLEREQLALERLEEALSWPSAERDARLASELADDPALLREVRELLQAADEAPESLPTMLPIAPSVEDTPPPERVGPYRLGDLLGHGGMGRVFRAERADGVFEQTVAVKLMRRSLAPQVVAEQFARERQILARLQHRHIAQLFDGGVTPDGHSYFVMELVAGRPVTQYAAEEALTLDATLRLFLQICSAVQYAHAHLVVHADIKPNNILITRDGTAKLLDFGVARALAEAGEASAGPVGFTYAYASPERQRGEAPTTVDDVYSLGILLGELLQRFPALPADLSAVCTYARASEPRDRYASVEALQEDVRHWFDRLPVRARRQTWRYLAGKFLARHRVAVAVGAAGVLFLTAAASALAVLYVRAERARAQAEERFADLHSLSRFVLLDVYDRLEAVPRALTLRRDIAAAGQSYLDKLSRDADAPVAVRLDVIEGLRRLAQVQATPGSASMAQPALARENLDRAEVLAEALSDDPADRKTRSMLLARISLARTKLGMGQELDLEATQGALDRADALLGEVLRESPGDEAALALKLDSAVERASILQWRGQYPQAVEVSHAALDESSRQMSSVADFSREARLRHARLLDIHAESLYYSGDPSAAEQPYRQQLAALRDLANELPQDAVVSRCLQRAGWALGTTLLELNRPREAEPILAESLALAEKLELLEPDDKDLRRNASVIANAEAQALVALGRFEEALPILEHSVSTRLRIWEEAPEHWGAGRDYAIALATLADARADVGDARHACEDYGKTLDVFDRIRTAGRLAKLDEDHALRLVRERVARHCRGDALLQRQ